MPSPGSSPQPVTRWWRLTRRILSVVVFNFVNYLTIGLPLAVLPGYMHDHMGYSAFWAGLVVSLQYLATLLSRPYAGRYADRVGPKRIVVLGLGGCLLSGVCYLLSLWTEFLPVMALTLLCAGRVILGLGQSFVGTGATLWGVGAVGSSHIGRVISWNGVASYSALAVGAPLGVWLHHLGGLGLLSAVIILIAGVAIGFALPRQTVKTLAGKKIPFSAVVGKIWRYGLVLGFASCGFGVIATFITLFYAAHGWDGGAFALTLFSAAFVGTRLLFPNSINRYGGLLVSLVCYTVEIIGLLLVWLALSPFTAQLGALLTGAGFSLVFPALGVVAMKQVPAQNQGSALATFTAFMDLSLGIVGPLAGMLMARAGAASIYLAAALLVFAGLLMTLSLRRRQLCDADVQEPY
ncbi:MAG: MFS transporter [Sodalis sp. (in: enterobacteria)]|uniref:MFS transporter n=1 Tax=Sodalis sp. (in: enterobacteria) TaxID=1898979 RepID=UPI0039E328BC